MKLSEAHELGKQLPPREFEFVKRILSDGPLTRAAVQHAESGGLTSMEDIYREITLTRDEIEAVANVLGKMSPPFLEEELTGGRESEELSDVQFDELIQGFVAAFSALDVLGATCAEIAGFNDIVGLAIVRFRATLGRMPNVETDIAVMQLMLGIELVSHREFEDLTGIPPTGFTKGQ